MLILVGLLRPTSIIIIFLSNSDMKNPDIHLGEFYYRDLFTYLPLLSCVFRSVSEADATICILVLDNSVHHSCLVFICLDNQSVSRY